jgi:hypothetical protein
VAKHVLTNKPSGPEQRENVAHCRPEPTVIARASALPRETFRLAGVSGGDESDDVSKPGKSSQESDVAVVGDSRESSGEDFDAVGVDLAEPDRAEAGTLRRDGKAADAAAQVEVGELTHLRLLRRERFDRGRRELPLFQFLLHGLVALPLLGDRAMLRGQHCGLAGLAGRD